MDQAPPSIFSRRRNIAKWARALTRQKSPHAATFLLTDLVEDVTERITFMRLQPSSALVIGDWSQCLPKTLEGLGAHVRVGQLGVFDEEQPLQASGVDVIVHLMGLGMVNDLPGALIHARIALADGGLFFAAFPGAGSLTALRSITLAADGDRPSPRIHPMIDNPAASALLQRAGFKRQVVDSHTLSVRYSSLGQLVNDLRDNGLTNSLKRNLPPFTRTGLERAQSAFDSLREDDGKVTETFEMMTLTAWK